MDKIAKKIYRFIFIKHDIGFFRFSMLMLVPCAIFPRFCLWWMVFYVFLLELCARARAKGWNKAEEG